jgi:magnesium transporter
VQGADFVLTFQERDNDFFDDVMRAIRNNVLKIRTRQSDYLFSVLLNGLITGYMSVAAAISDGLEELESALLADTGDRDIGVQMQELRRDYMQLKRTVLPLKEQYSRLFRSDSSLLHRVNRPFFNDVNDHLLNVAQNIDICRETLSSLMDLYISNNDLRMNDIMKRLTVVSTIFIPLTFLVGVWGMNFRNMPELEWEHGYILAWGVMIVIGFVTYLFFRTKKWR